jgi:ribosome biogenesis protein Nip4
MSDDLVLTNNKMLFIFGRHLRNSVNRKPTSFPVLNILFLLKCFRGISFLGHFLHEFGQGDTTVEDAMNKAYGQTLKRFHGWITRGIFSVRIL